MDAFRYIMAAKSVGNAFLESHSVLRAYDSPSRTTKGRETREACATFDSTPGFIPMVIKHNGAKSRKLQTP